ncbi:DMT family transporter [Paenibacillus sp. 481]|uniref:DMT family transporter n=1 Tax=Paenibacillus sp. 481 TaxID=2835869 RepID=UPI001E393D9F|nr:multidrug efflux SMR transporter [Paenibacillus sp. 481]UHA73640.1 multidrug efflux SMR transporter [Paenibacillus sp. 481]
MYTFLFLAIAIVSEVIASTFLKVSNGFSKWLPSLGVVIGYGVAFYTLSLALQELPLSLAYAIWAGVGTALTAVIGIVIWKEHSNLKTFLGLALIIGGTVVLNFANGGAH